MTVEALGWWVEGLATERLGCSRADAARLAETVTAKRVRDPVLAAATIALLASATGRLPGGAAWWQADGATARSLMLEGRADRAERLVARAVEGTLDADWDEARRTAEMVFAASSDPEA